MFSAWREARRQKRVAHALYGAVVAQSRNTHFHTHWGVPDSLDGRFDVIVLHLVLVIREMQSERRGKSALAQHLFDAALAEIDAGLREAGVGDTIVPKKLAKMSRVFYGRARAYERDFASNDVLRNLTQTFQRNLMPDCEEIAAEHYNPIAAYALAQEAHLKGLADQDLENSGKLFQPVSSHINAIEEHGHG